MKKLTIILLFVIAAISAGALLSKETRHEETSKGDNQQGENAKEAVDVVRLEDKLGLKINNVEATPWPQLFVIMTDRGVFYTNAEATLLIQGNLYDITDRPENWTEKFQQKYVQSALPEMKDDWIEFTAPEQKQALYVFTSPSCGYCRKLHNEMDDYLSSGITVRYLALPRAGTESSEFKNMTNTWCNTDPDNKDNRVEKFNNMMAGSQNPADVKCDGSLNEHLALARNLNVNSTPILVTENGEIMVGYRPASQIVAQLTD